MNTYLIYKDGRFKGCLTIFDEFVSELEELGYVLALVPKKVADDITT